jgi:RimJ/RimL family protein N-acetyltransferase
MTSERLAYQPVSLSTLDAFHTLVQDPHVRRYLMDGQVYPLEWSEERVRASLSLFDRRGVGLWLAHDKEAGALVGFCGFLEIPAADPEPQLVYALFQRYTGRGYATEMAEASIAEARRHDGFDTIAADVDEINVASAWVLEKLGFRRISVRTGSFGQSFQMSLDSSTVRTRALTSSRGWDGQEPRSFPECSVSASWPHTALPLSVGRHQTQTRRRVLR